MKLILFQLLTNFTIGSLVSVTFDSKIFIILEIMYKPTIKSPFHFEVILMNQFGGFEYCGIKCLKDVFKDSRMYFEIQELYKTFYLKKT